MQSPAESGWNETRYACGWLEARMRITRDLAASVSRDPGASAVHDVRVACRRLREAIAFFRRAGVGPLADVDRAAKRMARAVARLREADVARHRLAALDGVDAAACQQLIDDLRKRRGALAKRDARRIAHRARDLSRAITARLPMEKMATPEDVIAEGQTELKVALTDRVDQREREVERLWAAVPAAAPGTIASEQLHAVRVAVKHWRYASEIGRAVIPTAEYRELAAKLQRLQRAGGKSQDWADVSRIVAKAYRESKLTAGERALRTAVRAAYVRASRAFAQALSRELGGADVTTARRVR